MSSVAGHEFVDTPKGRRCTLFSANKNAICNALWLDVREATEVDINHTTGIAHAGVLTHNEYQEIARERDREREVVWAAVIDAASSGSR